MGFDIASYDIRIFSDELSGADCSGELESDPRFAYVNHHIQPALLGDKNIRGRQYRALGSPGFQGSQAFSAAAELHDGHVLSGSQPEFLNRIVCDEIRDGAKSADANGAFS